MVDDDGGGFVLYRSCMGYDGNKQGMSTSISGNLRALGSS